MERNTLDVWQSCHRSDVEYLCIEYEYYCTHAESHGSDYLTKLSLSESRGVTSLTMNFTVQAESKWLAVLSKLMRFFIKKSMINALKKDFAEIKHVIET